MNMEYKIVVMREDERLWWAPKDVVIEKQFQYIIDNYDSLPDYVVFLRGNPYEYFSVIPLSMELAIQDEMAKGYTVGMPFLRNPWDVCVLHQFPELRIEYFYKLFFEEQCTWSIGPKFLEFSLGSQYIVPKQCILARPFEFYKKLNELDWKTAEYLLKYVYDPSVPLLAVG
jgi:hypothetical protein